MQRTLRYPGFWLAVGLVAIGLVCQGVFTAPLQLLDILLHGDKGKPAGWFTNPWVMGVINLLSFGVATGVGLLINGLSPRRGFPFGGIRWHAWLAVPLLATGAVVVLSEADNVFRWFLPPPKFLAEFMAQMFFPRGQLLGQIFLLVIVAPVTEELLFRGVILRGLLGRFRPWTAVLLTALLFAGMHMNPWQFVSAFVLGVILGWFYLRTGSLWPCLLGHACMNSAAVIATVAPFGLWQAPTADDFSKVEFQPWWLDLAGVVLMAVGAWLFKLGSPTLPEPPPVAPPEVSVPPVLPVS